LFPFGDGGLVAFHRPPFRLLVAPAQLVQELADMIAMVSNPKVQGDQIGNPLGRPQIGPVSVGESSMG